MALWADEGECVQLLVGFEVHNGNAHVASIHRFLDQNRCGIHRRYPPVGGMEHNTGEPLT